MIWICFHCGIQWNAKFITRCPACNSANVGPDPGIYHPHRVDILSVGEKPPSKILKSL